MTTIANARLSTFHVKQRRRRVPLVERVRMLDALARAASGIAQNSTRRARRSARVVELTTASMVREAAT